MSDGKTDRESEKERSREAVCVGELERKIKREETSRSRTIKSLKERKSYRENRDRERES